MWHISVYVVFEAKEVDEILRRLYMRHVWQTEPDRTLAMKEMPE